MQALNKYRPFVSTGDDFADSNPIFSFYFYRYFYEIASDLNFNVQDPVQKGQIGEELKEVEAKMSGMQTKSKMNFNQQQNMKDILQYTQLMFAKNQHQFAENFRSKQMAEDYLTFHRLYQVVKHFNGLNEQQNKRRVFSKKRFIDMMKELKNKPEVEKKEVPPPPPPPKPIEEKIKQSVFKAPLPKPSKVISYDKIQTQIQANKRLQNAISQLSFDRYKFAKEEIIQALSLLQQLCD